LDLNAYEGVWDGTDASESAAIVLELIKALNPLPDPNRALHPADVALLGPISRSADAKGHEKPPAASEVSWMRNSNLFMRKTGARRREGVEAVDR